MTEENLTYNEIPERSVHEILTEFASGVPGRVASALLSAAWYAPSREWAELAAVALSNVEDLEVQWATTLALGHVAQRSGHLNKPALSVLIRRLRARTELAARLDDLEDDLSTFLS
ncbi:MAG: hypothetical protein ACRDYC_03290 [Acidimicrobiales bacterium]